MRMAVLAATLIALQAKATLDPVYTSGQATRGETVYTTSCSSCHAPDLSGSGQAPALAGKEFNEGWNGQTLADLFDRIQTTMPADSPGSLKAADTADVMAFILSKAMFPAGEVELPTEVAPLKEIKFVAPKQ